jgi:hypothetical protein
MTKLQDDPAAAAFFQRIRDLSADLTPGKTADIIGPWAVTDTDEWHHLLHELNLCVWTQQNPSDTEAAVFTVNRTATRGAA